MRSFWSITYREFLSITYREFLGCTIIKIQQRMSESQLIKTSEKFLCDTVYIEMVLERYGTSRHSDDGGKTLSATSFGEAT